jgi:hypothetical protein
VIPEASDKGMTPTATGGRITNSLAVDTETIPSKPQAARVKARQFDRDTEAPAGGFLPDWQASLAGTPNVFRTPAARPSYDN